LYGDPARRISPDGPIKAFSIYSILTKNNLGQ